MSKVPSDPRRFYDETMPDAPDAVRGFYAALTGQNKAELIAALTDDFTFESPLAAFASPEAYAEMVGAFGGWVETRRLIVNGDQVAHEFLYHMTEPAEAEIPICELFELRDGKIRSSRAYNNAADFPTPA